jgi:hypothetical protein
MYKDKFVLSVIHNGRPVKETGPAWNKEVVVPFDSEYKIRLKNKNYRSCTARVFIDGKKVSQLGDFIINSHGTIDLERFVDRSLAYGKRFKFVPLDNPDVDDPTDSSNGIIKVEFRLAKESNGITIHWQSPPEIWPPPFKEYGDGTADSPKNGPDWTFTCDSCTSDESGGASGSNVFYSNSNMKTRTKSVSMKKGMSSGPVVENGATIEGGKSTQSFTYSQLDVVDVPTVLTLKMVGLSREEHGRYEGRYCTQCGNRARTQDKYCSKCGSRL